MEVHIQNSKHNAQPDKRQSHSVPVHGGLQTMDSQKSKFGLGHRELRQICVFLHSRLVEFSLELHLCSWINEFLLLAGRLNSSTLASEFVYSLPNLMVLFNDQIIRASRNPELVLPSLQSKIKIWLTIIDYTEALLEVSAKRFWGEAGRWFIIALIQLLK